MGFLVTGKFPKPFKQPQNSFPSSKRYQIRIILTLGNKQPVCFWGVKLNSHHTAPCLVGTEYLPLCTQYTCQTEKPNKNSLGNPADPKYELFLDIKMEHCQMSDWVKTSKLGPWQNSHNTYQHGLPALVYESLNYCPYSGHEESVEILGFSTIGHDLGRTCYPISYTRKRTFFPLE